VSCIKQYGLSSGFELVDLNYVASAPHTVQSICNSLGTCMCEIVSLAFTQLQDATRRVMRLKRFVFFFEETSITAAVIREKQRIPKPGSL
jgi:hypothetical protein